MLYLVVRHRRNPEQPWYNEWLDDDRVDFITTSLEIGAAVQVGDHVRFHRCGYGAFAPVICAEARVAGIQREVRTKRRVYFRDHTLLLVPPPKSAAEGLRAYRA